MYQWYQNGIPFSTDSILIQPISGIYQLQITTNSCSILSNDISFQSNVDIKETYEEISMNLYPNPFKNQAILDLSEFQSNVLQIYIIDTKGRKVREYNNVDKRKLNIRKDELTSGVYILEIKSQNYKSRSKIVIN